MPGLCNPKCLMFQLWELREKGIVCASISLLSLAVDTTASLCGLD